MASTAVYMGAMVKDVTSETQTRLGLPDKTGALVTFVVPNSPADQSGIKVDDVITNLAGFAIPDSTDFNFALQQQQPGYNVTFSAFRQSSSLPGHIYSSSVDVISSPLLGDIPVPPPAPPAHLTKEETLQAQFGTFGNFTAAYGPGYQTTGDFISAHLKEKARTDTPPIPPNPWELSIGACKFSVPPTNIQVHRGFQTGALSGGAIRQINPPKFNSGHSETGIDLTIYFPNQESIWGYSGDKLTLDFDKDSDHAVDEYLSSLRGLITAFRYTPILPITNQYLNSTFKITSVAMKAITVSTESDQSSNVPFPFCIKVDLELLAFDHTAYLPMVTQLQDAMDWGKYRQYMGRCAYLMEAAADQAFATTSMGQVYPNPQTSGAIPDSDPNNLIGINDPNSANYDPTLNVTESVSFDISKSLKDATNIEFYYPPKDPNTIIPDISTISHFLPDSPQGGGAQNTDANAWGIFKTVLGTFNVGVPPNSDINLIASYGKDPNDPNNATNISQLKVLSDWLSMNRNISDNYSSENEKAFVATQTQGLSGQAYASAKTAAEMAWVSNIYQSMHTDPNLKKIYDLQAYMRGQALINEWEVPMAQLPLDPTKTIVQSVSVQTVNNFARIPLNMRDQPVYQHIGGLGTTVEINLFVLGEEDLTSLRLMFDTIASLSRLEHAHAVLGFLGLKNIIISLCGTKYVIPNSFNVHTVEMMPHAYLVKMLFTDFDIFQQKRETLSSEQQEILIQEFGKANPFLRLKQNWSAFNAYPDFPLSVTNKEDTANGGFTIPAGSVVGHLDPDFYFKSFSTVDPDLATLPDHSQNGGTGSAKYAMVHHLGNYGADGQHYSIGLNDGYWDLRTGNDVHAGGMTYNEPHTGNTQTSPLVKGLSAASNHSMPNFHANADGSQSNTGLPDANFKLMMQDTAYRDQSGRMIRAYPTYMLWLINEGGLFAGQQLYDNFYGLQSVLDFSLVDNEDVMGSTLIIRVSNLYSRLSTTYSQQLDPNLFPGIAKIINPLNNMAANLASGTSNTVINIPTVNIQPGVRLHLRAGYGSNPNLLQTIFNGTVTSVQVGDVMTITAQSDAIELGAIINNTNSSGSTGDISGSLESGLNFTEPRDLMVRLLSMGSGSVAEVAAQATAGAIYSKNRFGVRHFGRILYDSMTPTESANHSARQNYLSSNGAKFGKMTANGLSDLGGAGSSTLKAAAIVAPIDPIPLLAVGATDLLGMLNDLWTNFSANKDLEIFKRNIYPGNGTGIGQYTGGDLGDGGTAMAFIPAGMDENGNIPAVGANGQIVNNQGYSTGLAVPDAQQILADAGKANNEAAQNITAKPEGAPGGWQGEVQKGFDAINPISGIMHSGFMSNLLSVTGVSNPNGNVDEGAVAGQSTLSQYCGPFAEVSFMANTYMKTIWECFLECAALLPNYIVAVRPFEERSTVFYGKPHWAYTSGVIPVTTGRSAGTEGLMPSNTALSGLSDKVTSAAASNANPVLTTYEKLTNLSSNEWEKIQAGGTSSADPATTATATTQASPEVPPVAPPTSPPATPAPTTSPYTNNKLSAEDLAFVNLMAPYAKLASSQVGWDSNLILAQWACETGWGSSYQWKTNFNPAGLNITSDASMGSGYGSVAGGVKAWVDFILGDKAGYYNGVKAAVGPAAQAVALGNSPWAAGKYDAGTGPGSTLLSILSSLGNATESAATLDLSSIGSSAISAASNSTQSKSKSTADWTSKIPVGTEPETYAAEHGDTIGVPVDFTGTNIKGKKETDVLGNAAKSLYSKSRIDSDANNIWDNFRTFFNSPTTVDSKDTLTIKAWYLAQKYDEKQFDKIVKNFIQFMWTNAYHRGWIVLTADAVVQGSTGVFQVDSFGSSIESIPIGLVEIGVNDVYNLGASVVNSVGNTIKDAWGWAFGGGDNNTKDTPDLNQTWDFPRAADLFEIYVEQGNQAAISWMQANNEVGYSEQNPLARLAEEGKRDVVGNFKAVTGEIQDVASTVTNVVSSVIDTVKVALNMLAGGANLAQYAGGQANLLNGIYNDSIYYDENLVIGSLMWNCDNAFTREYGEPVVEIREPFQRLHYINSFQHIIANGIIENSDQVATVVTCTTDGAHPITASFDKGAPAERQVEINVDSGLQWQAPAGLTSWLFHPIQAIRSFMTHFNNGDQATNANRIARWHLKENLKNIYMGELIIIGDPQIRTHDLVYLYDSYEKMYGLFEVEQVVHQFTPDMGFITSITPNAIVIINDPAKWQFGSIIGRQGAAQAIRNATRQTLGNASGNSLVPSDDSTTLDKVADNMGADLLGTVQYTGGIGGVVKDFGGAAGQGGVMPHPTALGTLASVESAGTLGGPGGASQTIGNIDTVLGWPVYSWLRDNLYDAHACYIQYLNRNGTPMDAGLSYNFGTAVGQANVITFLGQAFSLDASINGESTISTSDLLTNIGWQSKDVLQGFNGISLQENYCYTQTLKLSGQQSIPIGTPPTTKTVNIENILDGVTFTIDQTINGTNVARLAFLAPPASSPTPFLQNPNTDLSAKSQFYLQGVLASLQEKYGDAAIVLQINPSMPKDPHDPGTLNVVAFYNLGAADNSSGDDRKVQLLRNANNYPGIAWDDTLPDGTPYTLNQLMLSQGLAFIDPVQFGGINGP